MNTFFIGDAFLIKQTAMSQVEFIFGGAKKSDNADRWEVSVLVVIANGYAGGSSVLTWEVSPHEELRVSGKYKGYFNSGYSRKAKAHPVKSIKFREIAKDRMDVEFIV